jgi:hypothetical protein
MHLGACSIRDSTNEQQRTKVSPYQLRILLLYHRSASSTKVRDMEMSWNCRVDEQRILGPNTGTTGPSHLKLLPAHCVAQPLNQVTNITAKVDSRVSQAPFDGRSASTAIIPKALDWRHGFPIPFMRIFVVAIAFGRVAVVHINTCRPVPEQDSRAY